MILFFEGMDNCLKDTTINSLRGILIQPTQVIKCSAPPKSAKNLEDFQKTFFADLFDLVYSQLTKGRNLFLNRAHLGEVVYSPIYRGYSGSWIYELEHQFLEKMSEKERNEVFLILLFDSDVASLITREDGKSFSQRKSDLLENEIQLFKEAFAKSKLEKKIAFDLKDYRNQNSKDKIEIEEILEKILRFIS
ncbi:hypothetical protein [Jiulongibacter sediminis]|uniref:Thymidylate kinase-like domain-containing protein n=1 Tax=Jiulongibacter sediminis TaxID=1605367 RepID=A0A0P7BU95_9BACT|nr:hypothetical protein [Jiulongibacter sediminis]KPM48335.1 hypothetical protein AFM12_06705 [Jiulongibacter sediminis]TBX24872.1 hypothetical protein TK44_06710 [Jiulongibacter sediminis]